MEEKVVLVTGSTSGIGRAAVLQFARLGCRLVIHGTDCVRAKQVATECKTLSPKNYEPLVILGDLSKLENVNNVLQKTIDHFQRLDVLVNNAGLYKQTKIDHTNAFEVYRQLMTINLDQVVLICSKACEHLRKTKGCIVNVSSNLAHNPLNGTFAYSTSKAGLGALTKSMAIDLAPTVRVNSVSPGPVATNMPTRSGMSVEDFRQAVGSACLAERVGEPDEIARVIVFLASPSSEFITGSDFIVDGGSSIKPAGKVMGE